MAYEEKLVPSSAKEPSITCSHAICQGGAAPVPPSAGRINLRPFDSEAGS